VGRRTTPLDSLSDRVDGLRLFVAAAEGHLPGQLLAPVRTMTGRAGERLALSRDHTVVALAGSTGSGKSSLFNALAGMELSTVGVRRPTTGVAHACVWGPGGASELLDWLGVTRRSGRAPDGDDQQSLRGLVLLDLPDFDSVEAGHRIEVDRLLELVDLIVWVLDPQKYADKVLHKRYLSQFHRHRDITVVVLNQSDLLAPSDVERCLNDLRGLLTSDGLAGVPLLATSAVDRPALAPLREILERTVEARLAALHRLAADVDSLVDRLAPLVAADPPKDNLDRGTARELVDALANAAGVPLVVRATERAYVHRAIRSTGWPLTRWLRRLRPDPLVRLHLGPAGLTRLKPSASSVEAEHSESSRSVSFVEPERSDPVWDSRRSGSGRKLWRRASSLDAERSAHRKEAPSFLDAERSAHQEEAPSFLEAERSAHRKEAAVIAVTSLPPAAPAAKAAVGLALRAVAERAGGGLPSPWPDAVLAAARAHRDDLTDALDTAVARTDLGVSRRPLWWRVVGGLQWFSAVVALGGLVWLGLRLALFAVGLPDLLPAPLLGRLQWPTVLLFGGLVGGLLVSIVVKPIITVASRRKGARAAARLRQAVERVAADLVLTEVRQVLHDYAEARAALKTAATP
jgi:GTP-binding protein EngB required for normal cell division